MGPKLEGGSSMVAKDLLAFCEFIVLNKSPLIAHVYVTIFKVSINLVLIVELSFVSAAQ